MFLQAQSHPELERAKDQHHNRQRRVTLKCDWAKYASPWCKGWDGVGGRGALSSLVWSRMGGWMERGREAIVAMINVVDGFIFILEETW